jgi:hypothetical protein
MDKVDVVDSAYRMQPPLASRLNRGAITLFSCFRLAKPP